MSVIRILSDRVANQIAAGEVIERPAAVVKELVENSLDAGATRIEVEFRAGGRALIRVEDNGAGMDRDSALLSLERHATSKLVETSDLDRLATFGFRGEALPSIASVSRFEMQTRRAGDPAGTEVLVNGGKLVHARDCGAAPGTRITVAHLFNSVPARRKFLKSDATESAHIIQCVRLYALACPAVAFTLVEDGRVLFQSPACTALPDRVAEVFGRQTAAELLPVGAEESGLKLSGLIGKPGVSRSSRHEMLCFVNRRPVDSRTLNYALLESYATLLVKGRFPVAVLFLDLDPAAVDVNVHPAKREVRFRNEAQVRGFVIRTVLQRLREAGAGAAAPIADFGMRNAESTGPAAMFPTPHPAIPPAVIENRVSNEATFPSKIGNAPGAQPQSARPPAEIRNPQSAIANPAPVPRLLGWRFLGTAHGDYALFESPAGVVVLDRRSALERVWYERLRAAFARGDTASQRLLFPEPVELDAIGSALLLDHLKFLHRHGLEVAEFGRNFFRIEAVPDWLLPEQAAAFLRDVLGLVREGRLDLRKADLAEEEFARLAVSRAVRLADAMGETEAQSLVAQLFACGQPHSSPAGRPTHFELGRGELARRFQK